MIWLKTVSEVRKALTDCKKVKVSLPITNPPYMVTTTKREVRNALRGFASDNVPSDLGMNAEYFGVLRHDRTLWIMS